LSEQDRVRFQGTIAKHPGECIGTYRSNTRSQDLNPEPSDLNLTQQEMGSLFLLLSPALAKAAFFVRTHYGLERVREFDLDSAVSSVLATKSQIANEGERTRSMRSLARAVNTQGQAALAGFSLSSLARKRSAGRPLIPKFGLSSQAQWSLGLAAAGVTFGLALASMFFFSRVWRTSPPAPSPAVAIQPIQAEGQIITLGAARDGSSLKLSWNPPTGSASRAILHIQDGGKQVERLLTPSEFGKGTFLYEASNPEVSFRLEVYSSQPNVTGALQVVDARPTPQVINPTLRPPVVPRVPSASVSTPIKAPPVMATPTNQPIGSMIVHEKLDHDKLVHENPVSQAEPPAEFRGPMVHASAEYVPNSHTGNLLSKIPLLHKKTLSAPLIRHQEFPVLAGEAAQPIGKPVLVKVKVWVNPEGNVKRAELQNPGEPPNVLLANAALASAQNWTFEPSCLDQGPDMTQMLVNFNFIPR